MGNTSRVSLVCGLCLALGLLGCGSGQGETGPLPEGWEKNSAVFRGPNGSGYSQAAQVPVEWSEKGKKNILWKVPVALGGLASPIIWNNLVLLSGATQEKRALMAYDTKDGKLLWTGTYTSDPKAPQEYKVYQQMDSLMHAAPTPATDGKFAYAIFANGELAAFDLKDGKSTWVKLVGEVEGNDYGFSCSLLVYKDSVIVAFSGANTPLIRYEGASGNILWKKDRADITWASPILIRLPDNSFQIIVNGSGETSGWDPETGKKLWGQSLVNGDIAPSPIYGGGLVFVNFKDCGIFGVNPAQNGKKEWEVTELTEGAISDAVSMTTDGKCVYQFVESLLTCLNAKDGKQIYQKEMEKSSCYASPFIVNDKLYLPCGTTTLVGTTGPQFNLVGKGELSENVDCSPAVVEGRIYFRSEKSLYCIGAK